MPYVARSSSEKSKKPESDDNNRHYDSAITKISEAIRCYDQIPGHGRLMSHKAHGRTRDVEWLAK
jgi:hypothetical protein